MSDARTLTAEIERLKRARNAVVLAHNYMPPEIFGGVADITGDSLALAREAAEVDADAIVLAGVHFMAETAKILNPGKTVLIPDAAAGCSLAASITAADMRGLRARHPGVPIVVYVNTSAEVKAEADVCCTSSNAVEVVESLEAPRVIMAPDRHLARYVRTQTPGVEVIAYDGSCEVHELFTPENIREARAGYGGDITVLAHPECPEEVLEAADFTGSTSQIDAFIRDRRPSRVLLLTECSMTHNLAAAQPQTEFVGACHMCPHMKRNTLASIRDALERLAPEVEVDAAVAERARTAIERMLAVGRRATVAA